MASCAERSVRLVRTARKATVFFQTNQVPPVRTASTRRWQYRLFLGRCTGYLRRESCAWRARGAYFHGRGRDQNARFCPFRDRTRCAGSGQFAPGAIAGTASNISGDDRRNSARVVIGFLGRANHAGNDVGFQLFRIAPFSANAIDGLVFGGLNNQARGISDPGIPSTGPPRLQRLPARILPRGRNRRRAESGWATIRPQSAR